MKASPSQSHPLRVWREQKGYSPDKVSDLVTRKGGKLSARSVGEYEGGRRVPSYRLAKILVQISRNAFSIADLMEWPNERSAA